MCTCSCVLHYSRPFPLPFPSPPLPSLLPLSQGPSVTISETSPSTTEGGNIVLECLLDNGTPAANATWLFGDQPVAQLGVSNVQQVGEGLGRGWGLCQLGSDRVEWLKTAAQQDGQTDSALQSRQGGCTQWSPHWWLQYSCRLLLAVSTAWMGALAPPRVVMSSPDMFLGYVYSLSIPKSSIFVSNFRVVIL